MPINSVLRIRILMDPHLKSPAWRDADPDPNLGGKKARKYTGFLGEF